MMMIVIRQLFIFSFIATAIGLAGCGTQTPPTNNVVNNSVENTVNNVVTSGLRVCPEEMIVSRMPYIGGAGTSYYILNGQRREVAEFDATWLKANCKIPVTEVQ